VKVVDVAWKLSTIEESAKSRVAFFSQKISGTKVISSTKWPGFSFSEKITGGEDAVL
jgi:hypothetical protein